MAEHKGDDLTATGTHRAWTGETGSIVRAGGGRETSQLAGTRAACQSATRRNYALAVQLVELQELDRQGPQQLGQGQEVGVCEPCNA